MTRPTDAQVEAALDAFHEVRNSSWGKDEINLMRAALIAAEAKAWQPMETAPRDGATQVDIWVDGGRIPDCHFHCGEWLYWAYQGWDDEPQWKAVINPIAWRHVPAGPEEKS